MDVSGPAFPTESQRPPDSDGKQPGSGGEIKPFGEDGFSFWDLLDIVNPLQHLPVVSTLYRRITGDTIDPLPRIAGGVLFGGVVGGISSLANVVVKDGTGQDLGGHVLALVEDGLGFSGDDDGSDANRMLAEGSVPQGTPAADPEAGSDAVIVAAAGTGAGPGSADEHTSAVQAPPGAGTAWRAMFQADFYDAEAFDPKRALIDAPSAPAAAAAEPNTGAAPAAAAAEPNAGAAPEAAVGVAALSRYADPAQRTMIPLGRSLDLSG